MRDETVTSASDPHLHAAFDRLEDALRRGDVEFVRAALDRGLSPNTYTRRGDPLLTLASYSNQREVTALLLGRGADPEAKNDKGHTALAGAAFQGNVEMMRLLIEHGADPYGPTADGKTPLMFAEVFGRSEAASLLRSYDPEAEPIMGAAIRRAVAEPASVSRRRSARPDTPNPKPG